MVFVTGDTHRDFSRFRSDLNPFLNDLTLDDTIIICGDFGGVWNPNLQSEQEILDGLSSLNYTIAFVDGNHENFDALYEYEIVDFHGAKAHKIRDNVFHIMRGEIFELDGKKFFAFGGASSHDIKDGILDPSKYDKDEFIDMLDLYYYMGLQFRVKGISWWEQELPTEEEMLHGREVLSNHDYKVDFVITHCLPQSIASVLSRGFYKEDKLTRYFDDLICNGLTFEHWFCGHYHMETEVLNKFEVLYDHIKRIV